MRLWLLDSSLSENIFFCFFCYSYLFCNILTTSISPLSLIFTILGISLLDINAVYFWSEYNFVKTDLSYSVTINTEWTFFYQLYLLLSSSFPNSDLLIHDVTAEGGVLRSGGHFPGSTAGRPACWFSEPFLRSPCAFVSEASACLQCPWDNLAPETQIEEKQLEGHRVWPNRSQTSGERGALQYDPNFTSTFHLRHRSVPFIIFLFSFWTCLRQYSIFYPVISEVWGCDMVMLWYCDSTFSFLLYLLIKCVLNSHIDEITHSMATDNTRF